MIKMKTDLSDIQRKMRQIAEIYEDCVIEEYVKWAKADDEYLRSNKGFNDRTGNLRSSLGAAVFKDMELEFMTSFATVLNGAAGSAAGRRLAESLASLTKGRIAKVMVAGMDYSQMVEDIESKDVMESRRIQCEREAEKIVKRAAKAAERRIARL